MMGCDATTCDDLLRRQALRVLGAEGACLCNCLPLEDGAQRAPASRPLSASVRCMLSWLLEHCSEESCCLERQQIGWSVADSLGELRRAPPTCRHSHGCKNALAIKCRLHSGAIFDS